MVFKNKVCFNTIWILAIKIVLSSLRIVYNQESFY